MKTSPVLDDILAVEYIYLTDISFPNELIKGQMVRIMGFAYQPALYISVWIIWHWGNEKPDQSTASLRLNHKSGRLYNAKHPLHIEAGTK